MTDLAQMLVLVRVVQAGSIRGAASLLGMPKTTVSRKIAELEERLGARLLQRTTRSLSLTDVGRVYYDHGLRIAAELDDAERAVRSQQATPSGLLRVTAPVNAAYLGPIVREYLKRYPEVRLDLSCQARTVDLVEEEFDLGIRSGPLVDSSLIARKLGTVTWVLVAKPEYLEKRGRPRTIDDLKKHDCLVFGGAPTWRLQSETRGKRELVVTPRLLVNEMDVLRDAVMGGLGIALMPSFLCVAGFRAERLERVLPKWAPVPTPVHVVYPSVRHLSPTVRSFIGHLQRTTSPTPWSLTDAQ